MSAPTEAEIREAIRHHWNRQRDEHDVAPWAPQPLSGRLVDAVYCDLFVDVNETLYDRNRSGEHGMRGPLDETLDAHLDPIMAEFLRRITEGMASVIVQFAAEHPRYPRARVREAVA
jgi:hypothetical protein